MNGQTLSRKIPPPTKTPSIPVSYTHLDDFEAQMAKKPYVIMVVGVNGVGKTTTIGKLAYQFKKAGKSVYLDVILKFLFFKPITEYYLLFVHSFLPLSFFLEIV